MSLFAASFEGAKPDMPHPALHLRRIVSCHLSCAPVPGSGQLPAAPNLTRKPRAGSITDHPTCYAGSMRANEESITIEFKGQTYTGTYWTDSDDIITVWHAEFGEDCSQIAGTPTKSLARIMLRQLIQRGQAEQS